jgi:ribosomal protein S18 acetylase RimI-like enzyme
MSDKLHSLIAKMRDELKLSISESINETLNTRFAILESMVRDTAVTTETTHSQVTKNDMLHLKDELWGLIALPGQLSFESNPQVEIKELARELKADWLIVQASAWGVPLEGINFIDKYFEKEFVLIDTGKAQAFIAYIEGKPVASAGLLLHDDYGYLVGAATAPSYRGQGVYRSLLRTRLDILNKKNLPAVIHCVSNTSAPICLKLGFEKVCQINSFESVM